MKERLCPVCGKAMSAFDVEELEKCWNCGAPISTPMGYTSPRPLKVKLRRYAFDPINLWLLLPSLTLLTLIIASAFGLADWLYTALPLGIGKLALRNAGWGLLLVTVGSSVRWAYLRSSQFGYEGLEFHVRVIGMTILAILIQMCVPLAFGLMFFIVLGGFSAWGN
jgi:hypothetical protein